MTETDDNVLFFSDEDMRTFRSKELKLGTSGGAVRAFGHRLLSSGKIQFDVEFVIPKFACFPSVEVFRDDSRKGWFLTKRFEHFVAVKGVKFGQWSHLPGFYDHSYLNNEKITKEAAQAYRVGTLVKGNGSVKRDDYYINDAYWCVIDLYDFPIVYPDEILLKLYSEIISMSDIKVLPEHTVDIDGNIQYFKVNGRYVNIDLFKVAWSRQLREKAAQAKELERRKVLGPIDDPDEA